MSTDLFRTLADLGNPLPAPIAPPTLARRKAREIIDANPGATLVEIVAPAPIPLDYVCFHCSAGDEPRAA